MAASALATVDPTTFVEHYFQHEPLFAPKRRHSPAHRRPPIASSKDLAKHFTTWLNTTCASNSLSFSTGLGPDIVAHASSTATPSVFNFQLFVITRLNPSKEPITSRSTSEEIWKWASAMFSEQSRLFVYAIFLSKSTARLLRFEPSVVIASQHWDYLDDPWPLLQFFLRFASSSSRARGFDPTIQPASPAEEKLAHKHLLPWKDSKKLRPVVRIQVPGRTSRDPDRFVLAWHSLCNPTLEGKATRVYPVLDIDTLQVFCLKDSWRESGRPREEDLLRRMNRVECRGVPTFVSGGDLLSQTTTFHHWQKGLVRQHHRFLTRDIGLPLSGFKSTRQFSEIVRDSLQGLIDAFERCNIIHNDISPGNIMMKVDGQSGFLNDWDLASCNDRRPISLEHETTWPFVSIRRLLRPDRGGSHDDDVESLIWSVLHVALKYVGHSQVKNLKAILKDIFFTKDFAQAAQAKRQAAFHLTSNLTFIGDTAFTQFVQQMLIFLANRTERPLIQRRGLPRLQPLTSPRDTNTFSQELLDAWNQERQWRDGSKPMDLTVPINALFVTVQIGNMKLAARLNVEKHGIDEVEHGNRRKRLKEGLDGLD